MHHIQYYNLWGGEAPNEIYAPQELFLKIKPMDVQTFNSEEMQNIIVVLGSSNSDSGELSETAVNRLGKAVEFYNKNKDYGIICTGGFGEHFNTTSFPHAKYAADYLIKNGVPPDNILEYVISSNTIEDALKTKSLIENLQVKNLVIITSDFHMKRAKLLFKKYLNDQNLTFIEARSTLDKDVLEKLKEHEQKAILKLGGG
jgi:uncharacterized SAM-binding protein YcdF (DUF218 family)